MFYFESLARAIRRYVEEHPEGVTPAAQRLGVAPADSITVALIQFADDTTVLGTSRAWLAGLVDAISAWAERCRLCFNASKSSTTALTREARADRTPVTAE